MAALTSTATLRNELALLDEDGFYISLILPPAECRLTKVIDFCQYVAGRDRIKTAREEVLAGILQQIMRLRAEEHSLFAELGRTLSALSNSTVFSGPISKRK